MIPLLVVRGMENNPHPPHHRLLFFEAYTYVRLEETGCWPEMFESKIKERKAKEMQ
jgi:hypothetical protein